MLKIGRRASCTISLVLSVVTLAAVVVAAFFMPRIAEVYCRAHVTPADAPFYLRYTFILVVSYLILAVAAACAAVLLTLLLAAAPRRSVHRRRTLRVCAPFRGAA